MTVRERGGTDVELTEAEQRVLAVVGSSPSGLTPCALAQALWPDRRGQGLVIAAGSLLARLQRRGVLVRADQNGKDGGTKAYVGAVEAKAAPKKAAATPRKARRRPRRRTPEKHGPDQVTLAFAPPGWRPLGEVIRSAREARRVSQGELARSAGVAPAYMGAVESGVRVPSEEVLRAVARRLQVGVDRLLFLAGRLGEAADKMLREDGIAAAIVRGLVGLSPHQRRAVMVMIEALIGSSSTLTVNDLTSEEPKKIEAQERGRARKGAALANPTRRAIVALLERGPRAAGEIGVAVECAPATLSGHLRLLREERVLSYEKQGRRRIYALASANGHEATGSRS
jgi:transcriptional regulator with XRE-family HTH domain